MHRRFRDLFGTNRATLAALAEIRDRVERLETAPVPDLPPQLEATLAQLSKRDGELHDDIVARDLDWLALSDHMDDVDGWRKEIVIAVSEGIERTDRAERRIKASVQRAQKKLESLGYVDDGIEAEVAELRLIDGDRSEKGGVPTVSTPVENVAPEGSSVRGVPLETLKRARGFA